MRALDPNLAAHLAGEVTTLCWLWRITLSDGTKFGFTDHDVMLTIEGLDYEPETGLTPGETESRIGFSIDTGAVQGVLTSERITSDDINSGRFDNAVIENFRVNWTDTSQVVAIAKGRIGTIRQKAGVFEAEWIGQSSLLDRSQGRVFSRICDAEFGDNRCALDPANFPEGTTCPRTFMTCRDQFSNTVNFRGFPYLLGDDALTAAPQEGEIFNGGSRYDTA